MTRGRTSREGLAGIRKDHKRMRGKQWSEMVQHSDIARSL
jgi:hypothetical protein